MKNVIYFFLLLTVFFQSCSGLKNSPNKAGEDYLSFYQRFHKDSLFQVQRVLFPLNGYAIEGGRISEWEKNSWAMHKNGLEAIDTSVYQTDRVERMGKIQERIYQPGSGMLIERHFALLNKEWFLTFYLYVFL